MLSCLGTWGHIFCSSPNPSSQTNTDIEEFCKHIWSEHQICPRSKLPAALQSH